LGGGARQKNVLEGRQGSSTARLARRWGVAEPPLGLTTARGSARGGYLRCREGEGWGGGHRNRITGRGLVEGGEAPGSGVGWVRAGGGMLAIRRNLKEENTCVR